MIHGMPPSPPAHRLSSNSCFPVCARLLNPLLNLHPPPQLPILFLLPAIQLDARFACGFFDDPPRLKNLKNPG
jgi:hypothetical protein